MHGSIQNTHDFERLTQPSGIAMPCSEKSTIDNLLEICSTIDFSTTTPTKRVEMINTVQLNVKDII